MCNRFFPWCTIKKPIINCLTFAEPKNASHVWYYNTFHFCCDLLVQRHSDLCGRRPLCWIWIRMWVGLVVTGRWPEEHRHCRRLSVGRPFHFKLLHQCHDLCIGLDKPLTRSSIHGWQTHCNRLPTDDRSSIGYYRYIIYWYITSKIKKYFIRCRHTCGCLIIIPMFFVKSNFYDKIYI